MNLILIVSVILAVSRAAIGQHYGTKDTYANAGDGNVEEVTTYKPKVHEVYSQITPNIGDGKFEYYVETSDGLRAEQVGYLNARPQASQVHEGAYTTFDETGKVVMVNYIADKGGFRVSGHSLPTPPPVPIEQVKAREDILRQQEDIRQQHLANFRAAHAVFGRKY